MNTPAQEKRKDPYAFSTSTSRSGLSLSKIPYKDLIMTYFEARFIRDTIDLFGNSTSTENCYSLFQKKQAFRSPSALDAFLFEEGYGRFQATILMYIEYTSVFRA